MHMQLIIGHIFIPIVTNYIWINENGSLFRYVAFSNIKAKLSWLEGVDRNLAVSGKGGGVVGV